MDLLNTKTYLNTWATELIRRARISLATVKNKKGVRATWKKSGKQWQPIGHKKVTYKSKSNATGRLSKSLDKDISVTQSDITISLSMEDYGIYVDQGRKPGKYAPPPKLKAWSGVKGIQFRDFKTGRFIKKSAGLFMVNRKIKHFGIEKTEFYTKPLNAMLEDLPEEIKARIIKDLEFEFLES